MKILLINPGTAEALKKENLGLAYLAASLEKAGHTARIVDEVAGQNVEESLDAFRPDLVGISFMTMFARRAYALADGIRAKRGIPVVFGGVHATALPEEAIEHADAVIRGEAEITLPKLLSGGLLEGIIEGEPPPVLDDLPLPAREKLDLDFYAGAREGLAGTDYRTLGLITSRGCPYKCIFCVNSKRTAPVRVHSPERVLQEIRYLVKNHQIESVAFFDELITVFPNRLRTICESMVNEKLDRLRWECSMRGHMVSAELLALMKRAGCVQIGIGFESGSQRVLDLMGKRATVEGNLEAARRVHEAGLRLRGCFVLGTPGETLEDIRLTREFIRKAEIDFSSINYMTPFPGSALYDQVAQKVAEAGVSWDYFTTGDVRTFTCNDAMSADELRRQFERMRACETARNYSWLQMMRLAMKKPRYALHILANLRK